MRACLCLAAVALVGCGPAAPKTGTALLRFQASGAVKTSPNLHSPLLGAVYGNLFLSEDVSVSGPRAGSPEFGAIEVADVDLRTDDVSAVSVSTPALEPGRYTFLGFYDVNANGAVSREPDPGDPVTLPYTNQFDVEAGQETKRLVVFELVYN